MLDARARQFISGISTSVGRTLGKAGVSPNAVTVGGFILTVGASWFIIQNELLLAGIVLTGGGVLDVVDGAVARATNRTTKFGNFLDSSLDRFSDAVVLSAIVWLFFSQGNDFWGGVALAALGASLIVSYMRVKAESLGFECKVGLAERAERIILLIAGLVFSILEPVLAVLAVALFITLIQRFLVVLKQARR